MSPKSLYYLSISRNHNHITDPQMQLINEKGIETAIGATVTTFLILASPPEVGCFVLAFGAMVLFLRSLKLYV